MKQILLLLTVAALLAACATPGTPVAQPAGPPDAGQSLSEVTVFRSPT
jgi:hypothetical protein